MDELRLLAELRAAQKRTEMRLHHALRALELAKKECQLSRIAREEMARAQVPQDNLWCEVEKVQMAVTAAGLADARLGEVQRENIELKGSLKNTGDSLVYTLKLEMALRDELRVANDIGKARLVALEEAKAHHAIEMSKCAREERERCAKKAAEWTPSIVRSARQLELANAGRIIATKIRGE